MFILFILYCCMMINCLNANDGQQSVTADSLLEVISITS